MFHKPTYINTTNTSMLLAVWLANDTYDHDDRPKTISVTSLMRPTKQLALAMQNPPTGKEDPIPLPNVLASRRGTSYHDSIERSWTNKKQRMAALTALGVPQKIQDLIVVNPTPEQVKEWEPAGMIPLYLERRSEVEILGWTLTGKFDAVWENRVRDIKSTSCWSYQNSVNSEKYSIQGSIYRFLNPEIITDDWVEIDFIFNDWSAFKSYETNYPPSNPHTQMYPLMSVMETKAYITKRLKALDLAITQTQAEMPMCTREELWQADDKFAYYKGGVETKRSTKNFDSLGEANNRLQADGSVGIVITRPGKAKACNYCNAVNICDQAAALLAQGIL